MLINTFGMAFTIYKDILVCNTIAVQLLSTKLSIEFPSYFSDTHNDPIPTEMKFWHILDSTDSDDSASLQPLK